MSAQKLSDATATFGFLIPRSTIANMEAGRKDTISIQEASALAEALRVPLAALLYSPFHPGEMVRPVPTEEVPSYAAAPLVSHKYFGPEYEGSRIEEALAVVRDMEFNRSMLQVLSQDLAKEERGLKVLESGALRMTSGGVERVPADKAEIDKQRRDIEYYREQISLREQEDDENTRRLGELGIEAWPRERHYTAVMRHWRDANNG